MIEVCPDHRLQVSFRLFDQDFRLLIAIGDLDGFPVPAVDFVGCPITADDLGGFAVIAGGVGRLPVAPDGVSGLRLRA
jgi:hypothetical protein